MFYIKWNPSEGLLFFPHSTWNEYLQWSHKWTHKKAHRYGEDGAKARIGRMRVNQTNNVIKSTLKWLSWREREKKKRSTEWQNRIYNLTFLPLDTLLFVENLLNNFCWQFYGLLQQNRHTWDFHPEIWLSVQWNVYFQTIIAKFAVQKRFFTGKTNVYVSSLVERGKKTTELRGINK